MSEPIFDPTTEEIYQRIPEHFRRSDKYFDLKKYLASTGVILNDVNTLIERFDFTSLDEGGEEGDTSDLVDPRTADIEWLPWLAQLLGVNLYNVVDESTRTELLHSSNGYLAGTDAAIKAAVQTVLVGTKFVKLTKRTTSSGPGTFWDLLIQTLSSETLQNILPSGIIVPSSISNYLLFSEPDGDIERVELKIAKDAKYYKSRALEFTAVPADVVGDPNLGPYGSGSYGEGIYQGGTYGENAYGYSVYGGSGVPPEGQSDYPSEFYFYTPFYFPLDGTDPLTTMVDISYESGTAPTLSISAGIDLYHYNAGTEEYESLSTIVGVVDQDLDLLTMDRFLGRMEAIPPTTTHGRWIVRIKDVGDNAVVHLGHFGARKETNTIWVPKSADPVQAVIDRGAKPAGMKLWHSYSSSSWDELENGGTTTWNDLENAGVNGTWTDVEEYGS